MNERHDEQAWLERTRQHLDTAEDDIDGVTLGRLRAARREALATLETRPRMRARWYWLPAGGLALAIALTVAPLGPRDTPLELARGGAGVLEDLDLLGGEDSFDLIGELEFYRWIEQGGAELG